MRRAALLLAPFLALSIAAVQAQPVAPAPPPPGSEWAESTPAAQGMNGATMERLRQHLESGASPAIRSVVLVRNDKLVFEFYRQDVKRDDLHQINSATKSVLSALVGIALQQGS